MKDLMDQIVSVNKSANEKLEKANQKKENAFRAVELEKAELIKTMQIKTDEEIERLSRIEYEKLKDFESDMHLSFEARKQELTKIYDANRTHWIDLLVSGVLSGNNN